MQYTLIVEPYANYAVGRYGGAALHPYLVEFTAEGTKCFKHDAPIAWEALPKYMKRIAHAAARTLTAAIEMRG